MLGPEEERTDRSLVEDERAIEGLPIRLVIALVVGVASLAIMMQVLGTFDFGADQEVDIEFDDAVINEGDPVTITVVDDSSGEPIPRAAVIVRGDTLNIQEPHDGETTADGEFSFNVGSDVVPSWRTTQETGKIRFEVIPPADSSYTDDQDNDLLTIIRTSSP